MEGAGTDGHNRDCVRVAVCVHAGTRKHSPEQQQHTHETVPGAPRAAFQWPGSQGKEEHMVTVLEEKSLSLKA